jgi:DtxR family Mn-dependent transcriptional regulator
MEHAISDEMEAQMRVNLDNPLVCPHGNPLPDHEHVAAKWIPLISVPPGQKVILRRIHETSEENAELLRFLETHGIVPGALATVIEVLSFNQTVKLKMGKQRVTLGFPTARFISIEKAD